MKKKFATILALAMTMNIGIMNSFAAEDPEPAWILPRNTPVEELYAKYGVTGWYQAEAYEQAKAWAEAHKGDIPSIADERARYEAVAKTVVDFLEYDDNYQKPHIAFSIRDGKGVCGDYHTLGLALCQACNVKAEVIELGHKATGLNHDMLRVTINGQVYYSDLTAVDAGTEPVLMSSVPSEYDYDGNSTDKLISVAGSDGGSETKADSLAIHEITAAKQGKVVIASGKDGVYYGSQEDSEAIDRAWEAGDIDTVRAIFDKYGVPYAK